MKLYEEALLCAQEAELGLSVFMMLSLHRIQTVRHCEWVDALIICPLAYIVAANGLLAVCAANGRDPPADCAGTNNLPRIGGPVRQ